MFTDIVGYTAIAQENEARAVELLEEHRRLLRPFFRKNGGREIDTIGDAFLVEFASALDAVKCALGIQSFLKEENSHRPVERKIVLRIGMHLGDVIHKGKDVSGDAVNVASRIEPLAFPGGVCLTAQVYHSVLNKVECAFESMGNSYLKNVTVPVEVFRISNLGERSAAQPLQVVGLPRNRIAVLPFVNMSPDPNDEYFADGLTEETIASLSQLSELQVIARTSVMGYKGESKHVSKIGEDLKVGSVLEGSVRKIGKKIRVTAQLIDVASEANVWSNSYDRELDDIFTIQSEVAQKVADALKIRLAGEEKQRTKRGTNPEAYNLYLKGTFFFGKRNPDALRKAVDFYGRSVDLDPTFALGYAGIAQCYAVIASNNYDDPATYYPKAKETALKALSVAEDLSEARVALAFALSGHDRDFANAEVEFKRAIKSNPSDATAHHWYSLLLAWTGRLEEAKEEIDRALELNPLSLIINIIVGVYFYYDGRIDESISQLKRIVEMDSNFVLVYPSLIKSYLAKSMYSEALETLATYSRLDAVPQSKLWSAYVHAAMGKDAC